MLAWVLGVELGLSGGGPLSPTRVNLLKKFGACKPRGNFMKRPFLGLFRPSGFKSDLSLFKKIRVLEL